MPAAPTTTSRAARRAWHAYRAWRNLPATLVAVGWARLHGVRPVLGPDLLVECAPMPPRTYGRGGTTVGNAWLHGGLGGPARRRHESRHADQYALLGTVPFLALYGLNALLTGNDPARNVFERWAGLADGGYAPVRGTGPGTGRTRTARTATSSSA
ncbi:hypothetical protein [Kineococcus arenarius]|uniref:hypothetical protein n=1 Tax=unclassified Kineococcus TaxID=2621656 RepID=UPI003D7C97D1